MPKLPGSIQEGTGPSLREIPATLGAASSTFSVRWPTRAAMVTVSAILAAPAATAAQSEATFEARFRACTDLRDDSERLACFDAMTPAAAQADPERNFGVETLPTGFDAEGEAVDVIASRIEGLQRRPHGQHVFELANGQRWTELESGRTRYRRGQRVTIERTTLGAYMLSTEQGRATRVRRLD